MSKTVAVYGEDEVTYFICNICTQCNVQNARMYILHICNISDLVIGCGPYICIPAQTLVATILKKVHGVILHGVLCI